MERFKKIFLIKIFLVFILKDNLFFPVTNPTKWLKKKGTEFAQQKLGTAVTELGNSIQNKNRYFGEFENIKEKLQIYLETKKTLKQIVANVFTKISANENKMISMNTQFEQHISDFLNTFHHIYENLKGENDNEKIQNLRLAIQALINETEISIPQEADNSVIYKDIITKINHILKNKDQYENKVLPDIKYLKELDQNVYLQLHASITQALSKNENIFLNTFQYFKNEIDVSTKINADNFDEIVNIFKLFFNLEKNIKKIFENKQKNLNNQLHEKNKVIDRLNNKKLLLQTEISKLEEENKKKILLENKLNILKESQEETFHLVQEDEFEDAESFEGTEQRKKNEAEEKKQRNKDINEIIKQTESEIAILTQSQDKLMKKAKEDMNSIEFQLKVKKQEINEINLSKKSNLENILKKYKALDTYLIKLSSKLNIEDEHNHSPEHSIDSYSETILSLISEILKKIKTIKTELDQQNQESLNKLEYFYLNLKKLEKNNEALLNMIKIIIIASEQNTIKKKETNIIINNFCSLLPFLQQHFQPNNKSCCDKKIIYKEMTNFITMMIMLTNYDNDNENQYFVSKKEKTSSSNSSSRKNIILKLLEQILLIFKKYNK